VTTGAPPTPPASLLFVPARDRADELCAQLLRRLMESDGQSARVLPAGHLAAEVLDAVLEEEAQMVVISALPPAARARARYLALRLCRAQPELAVVIGLWTAPVDPNEASASLGCGAGVHVANTLAAAQLLLRQKLQSPVGAAGGL